MGVPSSGPFPWWLDALVFCIDRWWALLGALLAVAIALAGAVGVCAGWRGAA